MTPRRPRATDHRLPPILRITNPNPTSGYSKAPRGLFVLPRVGRIFTASSISPSPSLRQRSSRYAIRAGRNLPDKEFRYLRTVIVTAAVYRGFGSALARLPLTFRHRAGVTPYTAPYGLAGSCVFGKQSLGPAHCAPGMLHPRGATHARGPLLPKLRGQLAEFLNEDSPVHLGALAPAHLCRFAVRTLTASRMRLFWEEWLNPIGFGDPQPAPGLRTCVPTPLVAATPARRRAYRSPSPRKDLIIYQR